MKHDDEDKLPLARAAHESGFSKEQILSAVRDGELTEHAGRRYSLNELNALQAGRPFIMRRRAARC